MFVSLEIPDRDVINFVKQYGQLQSENLRQLYYSDEGLNHVERGIRVGEFAVLERDLPCKIVTQGLEIFSKYTGQPVQCYRCNSSEHAVKDCPKQCKKLPSIRDLVAEAMRTYFSPTPTVPDGEAMETRISPSDQEPSTAPSQPTQPSQPTNSGAASFAAITQNLFPDCSPSDGNRKRPPSSPAKANKPVLKKAISAESVNLA